MFFSLNRGMLQLLMITLMYSRTKLWYIKYIFNNSDYANLYNHPVL